MDVKKYGNISFWSWSRLQSYVSVLFNAASLVGSTVVTSGLGVVYWWLAARWFSADDVGLASALVSATLLLGTIGMFGVDTLLVGELQRHPAQKHNLIASALLVSVIAGAVCGLGFILIMPFVSPNLNMLAHGWANAGVFVFGVSLTAALLVVDLALIGLLRGDLQFWRNSVFAIVKLALLAAVIWTNNRGNVFVIYLTWQLGNVISLGVFARALYGRRAAFRTIYFDWNFLQSLGMSALAHQSLNLMVNAPGQLLPLLVTSFLSARSNGTFYIAWMIASFLFMGAFAMSTALFASKNSKPYDFVRKLRLTMSLSFGLGSIGVGIIFVVSDWLLSLFGATYGKEASMCLRMLAVGLFPLIIKQHYLAIGRVKQQVGRTIPLTLLGGILEISGAIIGAQTGGLAGLCAGWVIGLTVECLCMLPAVYYTLSANNEPTSSDVISEISTR